MLKLNVERMNGIADVVSRMRQMAGMTTSSPVDVPPSDPDVWPLPHSAKKTSAIPSLKNTSKKQTYCRADNKTKKVVGKSPCTSTGSRSTTKRANSVGRASLNEPSEVISKEEDESNSNVGVLYSVCW